MSTWTALTHCAGLATAEQLSETAEEVLEPVPVGSGVFEIEDGSDRWEVGLYFTEKPDEVALALLAASAGAEPFVISELPEVDWVAHVRRELTPVEAGRFFVYGGHDEDRVPEGAQALRIEAAMAFGTGHHDTTKGCLLALDRLISEGASFKRIADIGCGTAVLSMAAAREFPVIVIASDIDEIAVETAKANVISNGLDGRVECIEATGFDHPMIEQAAPFDLVMANILMQPLIDLAPEMARYIGADGLAILSGLLTTQADAVIAAYQDAGFSLQRRDDLGEWSTLVLKRG